MKFNSDRLKKLFFHQECFIAVEDEVEGSVNVPIFRQEDKEQVLADGNSWNDRQIAGFRFFGFNQLSILPADELSASADSQSPEDRFIIAGLAILTFKRSEWFEGDEFEVTDGNVALSWGSALVDYANQVWGKNTYSVVFSRTPIKVDDTVVAYQLIFGKTITEAQWMQEYKHLCDLQRALQLMLDVRASKQAQSTPLTSDITKVQLH